MTIKCASCGSEELLRRSRLYKGATFFPGEVVLDLAPKGWTSAATTELRALVCVACGHVQLHATHLTELRAAWEKYQETSLHLQ